MSKKLSMKWKYQWKPALMRWLRGWRTLESCPVMLRSTHREVLARRSQGENRAKALWKEENEKIHRLVDELIPKLVSYTYRRTASPFQTYQICVGFSDDMVRGLFRHGNSQHEMDYLCERIVYDLRREMRTINFARFEDERYGRYDAPRYDMLRPDWASDHYPSPWGAR